MYGDLCQGCQRGYFARIAAVRIKGAPPIRRAVTITSSSEAFEVAKAMPAQGLEWGEGYQPLGRRAIAGIWSARCSVRSTTIWNGWPSLVESIGGQSEPATRICKTARRQSPSRRRHRPAQPAIFKAQQSPDCLPNHTRRSKPFRPAKFPPRAQVSKHFCPVEPRNRTKIARGMLSTRDMPNPKSAPCPTIFVKFFAGVDSGSRCRLTKNSLLFAAPACNKQHVLN